ncbi:MAG: hypothetical protein AAFR84_02365 [Pseudomonadota bacterium]
MIVLSDLAGPDEKPRTFDAGRGVLFTYRLPTHADLIYSRGRGNAKAQLSLEEAKEANLIGEEADLADASERLGDIYASAEATASEVLVLRCTLGWEGVATPEGEPHPFDAVRWRAFANAFPVAADNYAQQLYAGNAELVAEGNVSSPGADGSGEGTEKPAAGA